MIPEESGVPVTDHGQTGYMGKLIEVAVLLERFHHEHGWDGLPAVVYEVGRLNDGSLVPEPFLLGLREHPRVELAAIAQLAETVPLPPRQDDWPWPLSHVLVMEAWAHDIPPDQREGRKLADIPGAVELRQAVAVAGARAFQVTRIRGHEPRVMLENDHVMFLTGGMAESLKRLHRATRLRHRSQGGP